MLSSGERISRTLSQLTSSIKTEQVMVRRKIRSLIIVAGNRTWFETDVYRDWLFSSNRKRTISTVYKLSVQWHKSVLNASTWDVVDFMGHDPIAPPKAMQTSSIHLRTSAWWFIRLTHEPQTSSHWCTPNLIFDYNYQPFLFPEKII